MQGRISDFTSVASRYDATRNVPEPALIACYDALVQRGLLAKAGQILDVGCGTGQISLPLAAMGLAVVGIDVAASMVQIAKSKVKDGQNVCYEIGYARSIKYADLSFDTVVFSKLFLHVEEWKQCCSEMIRVAKIKAHILQIIDWGTYQDPVRRDFTRRVDRLGFKSRFLGAVSSTAEIADHMSNLGCRVETIDFQSITWEAVLTRRQSLEAFRERLFAEFWSIADEVYTRVFSETYEWAKDQPGSLD